MPMHREKYVFMISDKVSPRCELPQKMGKRNEGSGQKYPAGSSETTQTMPTYDKVFTRAKGSRMTANSVILEMAESITAIVGLREAIVWKQDWLRIIWIISLLAGISATVWFMTSAAVEYLSTPTATKIELSPQTTYKYPLLVLCPDGWLDTDKAFSLGLSLDGIKYSIGYMFNSEDDIRVENVTAARQNFLDVYEAQGFSSLDDFYKAIAHDIRVTNQTDDFMQRSNATSLCPACVDNPEKVIYDSYVCYSFNLTAENGSHRSFARQFVTVKIADKTMGIMQVTRRWQLFVTSNPHLYLKMAKASQAAIHTFTWTIIRISVSRFRKLKLRDRPCVANEEMDTMYPNSSPDICYAKCMGNTSLENMFRCPVYTTYAAADVAYPPQFYCNFFEIPAFTHYKDRFGLKEFWNQALNPSNASLCNRTCPFECERTSYDVQIKDEVEEMDMAMAMKDIIKSTRSHNMSIVGVRIEHGATYDGGIFTLSEVDTVSFTSMVGNLGGSLGLFIGGTMMTFVQIILFPIKYMLDKREKNRKNDEKGDTRA